ncbi:hypothetical protein [Nostoc sp.]|uniref:hypothetical protein n=1 Tax=Nostoc sp. TaxID=1180 RepID=UPI002FFAEB2B
MFDNICKFLAENFSSDFATWLLGEPITLTELSPKELSLEPIRADALILLQSEQNILEVIRRVLRSDIMRESVIYQDILDEGKAEGKAEALLEVARNLFNTGMPLEQIGRVTGLSIEQLQYLQVSESNQ